VGHLELGELAVGEKAEAALHDVVLAHLHRAAREQLRHKQRRWQLLQVPTPHNIASLSIALEPTSSPPGSTAPLQ